MKYIHDLSNARQWFPELHSSLQPRLLHINYRPHFGSRLKLPFGKCTCLLAKAGSSLTRLPGCTTLAEQETQAFHINSVQRLNRNLVNGYHSCLFYVYQHGIKPIQTFRQAPNEEAKETNTSLIIDGIMASDWSENTLLASDWSTN